MNRHRAYWSAMGLEPAEVESVKARQLRESREKIQKIVYIIGFDETANILRKIYEESKEE